MNWILDLKIHQLPASAQPKRVSKLYHTRKPIKAGRREHQEREREKDLGEALSRKRVRGLGGQPGVGWDSCRG